MTYTGKCFWFYTLGALSAWAGTITGFWTQNYRLFITGLVASGLFWIGAGMMLLVLLHQNRLKKQNGKRPFLKVPDLPTRRGRVQFGDEGGLKTIEVWEYADDEFPQDRCPNCGIGLAISNVNWKCSHCGILHAYEGYMDNMKPITAPEDFEMGELDEK